MSHLACTVVSDASVDLVLRIHDKWTVADQRFIERQSSQHKEFGVRKGVKAHDLTPSVVERKLFVSKKVSALAFKLSFNDVCKSVVRRVDGQVESTTGRQGDVIIKRWREGEYGGGEAVQRANHHFDFGIAKFQSRRVFALVNDCGWVAKFLLGWSVEPNLKAVNGPAVASDFVA